MNSDPWPDVSVGSNKGAVLFLFLASREGEFDLRTLGSALKGAWPPTVTSGLSGMTHTHNGAQWNLSNPDTNGAEESVIVSEVSSIRRLKCMQEW